MKSIILIISLIFSMNLLAEELTTDAVYEKIVEEYTLKEDGSVEYHYYKKLRLNTHFSFNRLYGETFIVYHPKYQTLTINTSQTTMNDGKVVEGPFNSYNEVLPRFAANAPYYNDLKEMVVTHPGLEVGSVIELDYTIQTKPGFYPGLMADIVLTQSSPVTLHEIVVNVPSGTSLQYQVLNLRTGPEISESKKGTSYKFVFNGIKENSHERNQPADELHLPRLYFSTLSMQEAIDKISDQDAFLYKLDEILKNKVAELRGKCKDEVSMILKMQKMVANDMNTYGIPPYYTGFNIRTPVETWKSNGGTPCEKTLLLAAMLREAGINAKPVMVIPTKLYNADNGCLHLAESMLLQVNPKEHEQMYLSAVKTGEQNKVYSLNGKTILSIEPTKSYVEAINEKFQNKVITNGEFTAGDNFSVAGEMEISLTEKTNPYYSFLKDSTYAKSLIASGIPKKGITDSEIINSAQFRTLAQLKVDCKEPIKKQGKYYFWEVPFNKNGTDSWHITYLDSDRQTPYSIPNVIDEEYSYKITVPGSTFLINPVELIEKETEFGKLVLSTKQNGNVVVIKRMLVINRTLITPEEYPAFKEMMDLWNEKNFRKLIMFSN